MMKKMASMVVAALLGIFVCLPAALAECPVADLRARTPARVTRDVDALVSIDAPVRLGLLPGERSVTVQDARLLSFVDVQPSELSGAQIVKEEDMHFCYAFDVYGKARHLEDGARLYTWSDGNILYSDARGDALSQLWHYYRAEMTPLPPDEPLHADAQLALQRALEAAEGVGVPVSRDGYACTYLSAEAVAACAERFDREVTEGSLKRMDAVSAQADGRSGCYAFSFPLVYGGLELEDFFYISPENGEHVTAKRLEAIVAPDGVLYLSASFAYEATAVRREVSEVLSLEEAIDALAARLAKTPPDKPMAVYEIAFAYGLRAAGAGPDGFTLVPCWLFRGIEKDLLERPALELERAKDSGTVLYLLSAVDGAWVN